MCSADWDTRHVAPPLSGHWRPVLETLSLPAVDDLDLTVGHLCKVDLKVHFKVVTLAIDLPVRARRRSPEAYSQDLNIYGT